MGNYDIKSPSEELSTCLQKDILRINIAHRKQKAINFIK
jgi:hypothetical protein